MSALRDRAVTLFAEIAVRAGAFEFAEGRVPRNVFIPKADADVLWTYLKLTKPGYARRAIMLSGLTPHVVPDKVVLDVGG